MFDRYGRFVVRRARLLLLISALALVAAAAMGIGAFGKLQNGGFLDPQTESSRAQDLLDSEFGGRNNLILLVHATSGDVDSPAVRAAGTELAQSLAGEETVANVVSYWGTGAPALRSADGTDALIVGHVMGDDTQLIERARVIVDKYTGARADVTITASGDAAANVDVRTEIGRSLLVAEAIAVPLTMVLLIIAFGSMVAASLPLIIGLIAIMGTFAELFVLGSITDVSVFSINLTTALGLGLAIDYALLIVSRFREQLAAGSTVEDSVVRTVATAGRTIVFSAAAVAAALAALLVFPQFFLRSFAYAGIGVVAISAIGAMVVAPALLAVLGPRVNRGRLPWLRGNRGAESPLWGRLAAAVMRRPALAALPVVAVLLFAASPLLGVTFGTPDQGVLPPGASSRVAAERVQEAFPASGTNAIDVVTTGPVAADDLGAYAARISDLTGVSRVDTSAGNFADGQPIAGGPTDASLGTATAQRLRVLTTLEPKSAAAEELVHNLRDQAGPGGVTALVGGNDAQLVDTKSTIGERLPLAAALIVFTTFLLLFLFTGSVIQPLRALALNSLSISAALGAMTWIFQEGNLSSILGFTPRPMDTSMTVLLFCITFGLSMDYELFLTSRIKEMHDRGVDTVSAVSQGLARTGRIVSTAAGLIAVSFFAFGTGTVSFLQMFGLGCGLAILIDATLVRGILVPASMRLLGAVNWWAPGPLRWVHARLALKEA